MTCDVLRVTDSVTCDVRCVNCHVLSMRDACHEAFEPLPVLALDDARDLGTSSSPALQGLRVLNCLFEFGVIGDWEIEV